MIFIAFAFLQFACAAEDTQEQANAQAEVSNPDSAASEKVTVAAGTESQGQDSTSAGSSIYSIECGQVNDAGEPFCYVDGDTYIGWRTFHGFCHVCHAQDAVGSTFAPNLLDRLRVMGFDEFVDRTANGFTGQVGVMPPWKDNPNVSKRYKELFAYLKARSDGALPRGRPKKKR
jgi:cytochrome c5